MKKTIQITIDQNGEHIYTMKYPETVNLQLELSRSEVWWGVFLSVVETFQAIKEDRIYLLEAFENWKLSGFDPDFNINIDISVLEYDNYVSIYTGIALPNYTDDTLYFNCKFEQVGNIQKFLDRSIERSFDMINDSEQYEFSAANAINKVFDVINGNLSNRPVINSLAYGLDRTLRDVNFPVYGSGKAPDKSFVDGGNDTEYNYIGNKDVPKTKDIFFKDNFISFPKKSSVNIQIDIPVFDGIIPYAKSNAGIYRAPETFKIKFLIDDITEIDQYLTFEEVDIVPDYPFFRQIEYDQEINIENDENELKFVSVNGAVSGLDNYDNQVITYPGFISYGYQELRIVYQSLSKRIDTLPIYKILGGLFELDFINVYLLQNFNNYAMFPYDGAIGGSSTSTITLNIADFLEEIKKALCIGVTVNPDTNNLVIKPIYEMFTDNELFVLNDDVISNLSLSFNEALLINKLVLGAGDRKFNYDYDRVGQNIQTVYNARNAFYGTLDLSLTKYKSQSYDFVDSYRDDVFGLYEEDKNDGEFVLFQKQRINYDGSRVRVEDINSGHTAPSQVCAWSWLLKTISPNGYDSESESNTISIKSPIYNTDRTLINNIEPDNAILSDVPQKITLRKINATIKLTTEQYNVIVNNRDSYLTLIYKNVTYKGYINNLVLDVGKNMIAQVELLEKYEQ